MCAFKSIVIVYIYTYVNYQSVVYTCICVDIAEIQEDDEGNHIMIETILKINYKFFCTFSILNNPEI